MILWLASGCLVHTFVDRPVVTAVSDREPIPLPAARTFLMEPYVADVFALRSAPRGLSLPTRSAARDINALDELPDSSWFTNRDPRALSPEQLAIGPAVDGPPRGPFVVFSGPTNHGPPGIGIEDASGRRFQVTWDTPENPYQQTAAGIVVNRLFWGAGYHVPADTLVHFQPGELAIAVGSTYEDDRGRVHILTQAVLDRILASAPEMDGGIRGLASQHVEGQPVGGFAAQGRRADDPNDRVPHQHRRSLRGLRALATWVGHTAIKEDNTLDSYVGPVGAGHLVHYLVDFREALGAYQSLKNRREDGFEHLVDLEDNGAALLSLGLHVRSWERQEPTAWPQSVGWFTADPFDAANWKEAYPYRPFREAAPGDLFWGAKRVMAFDRAQLEAVVAEAHYPDPAAAAYVVETLLARQEAVGRAFIADYNGLDRFDMTDAGLCMVDVGVELGLVPPPAVRYRSAGQRGMVAVQADGAVCVPVQPGAYERIELSVVRDGDLAPWIEVHVRNDQERRVLGVVRDR